MSKELVYIAFRKEENLFELFDEETNTSYWLELKEEIINGNLCDTIQIKRVTRR